MLMLDLSPHESLSDMMGQLLYLLTQAASTSISVMDGLEGSTVRKKRYVKIHFAVDVKTRETVAMDVTTDDMHDSEVLPSLIANASRYRSIAETCTDRAYDSIKSYRLLKRSGIKPIIKPGRNAGTDRDPPERRSSAIIFKMLGEEEWSRRMSYGGHGGLLKQHSQHSNAYTENTARQKTWRA